MAMTTDRLWVVKTRGNRPRSKWLRQFESESEMEARAEFARLLSERTAGAVILVDDKNDIVDRGQCRYRQRTPLEVNVNFEEQIGEARKELERAEGDVASAKVELDEADDRARRWRAILKSLEAADAVMKAETAPGRRGRPRAIEVDATSESAGE
jgi:hypothetical protein